MSIYSMTGFGRDEQAGDNFTVTVEIKSVNNRFKDYRFKMPSYLNFIEIELRKVMDSHFKRGTFDIYMNIKKADKENSSFDLDEKKIKEFILKIQRSAGSTDLFRYNATEFLRKEFFVDDTEAKEKEMPELVKSALSNACEKLKSSRLEEGSKLIQVLESHKQTYVSNFKIVETSRSSFEQVLKEKLKKRFDENKDVVNVDENRFLQEIVYYLEKLDIDEEINRIYSHLKKLDSLLVSSGEVGRQIDFLVQELNRETNTIGSKSGNLAVSDNVVQMKVQLEKIREQALNLE